MFEQRAGSGVCDVLGMNRQKRLRKRPFQTLWAVLLASLLAWGVTSCSPPSSGIGAKAGLKPARSNLTEVSPPFAIQSLKQDLEIYQPQVKILSPRANQVLEDTQVEVRLQVNDLPLFKDEELELGPYLQVMLDNQPYAQVFDTSEPLKLDHLTPGTHTLRVFAVRPWHESFKNEGAFAQTTFHVFTQTPENNPDPKKPLLTYNSPQGTYGAEPILLDFYLTNAPLHLVAREDTQDAIPDWKIRCTINGESFTFDRWEPIYLKGLKRGKNWVQLELLDENGDPLPNVFNNAVQLVTYEPGGTDTLAQLTRGELTADAARKIVDPNYVPPPPLPEPEVITEPDVTQEPDLTKEPEPDTMPPEVIAPEPENAPLESAPEPTLSEPTLSEPEIEPEPEEEVPQEAPQEVPEKALEKALEKAPEEAPEEAQKSITVPSLELAPASTESPNSAPSLKIVPEPAANPNFMPPSLKVIPEPAQPNQPEVREIPQIKPEPLRQPERLESVEEKLKQSVSSPEPVRSEPVPTQLEMPDAAAEPILTAPAKLTSPVKPSIDSQTQTKTLETEDITSQPLSRPLVPDPIAAPIAPTAEIKSEPTPPATVPDMLSVLDRVKGFFEGLRKQPSGSQSPLLAPLLDDQPPGTGEEESGAEDEFDQMLDAIPERLEAPIIKQLLQGTPNSL